MRPAGGVAYLSLIHILRLDMDSYRRIVNNRIQNVIAHSHADKIKMALSKKENNMELLLADNGVGIEKEDLKHIFEMCIRDRLRAWQDF